MAFSRHACAVLFVVQITADQTAAEDLQTSVRNASSYRVSLGPCGFHSALLSRHESSFGYSRQFRLDHHDC